MTATVSNWS